MPIYRCFANLPRICQFSNSTSIFRISPIMQVLVKSEEYFRKGPCNYLAVWTIYWCEKGHIEIFTPVLRSARDHSSNWNAYSNTRYKWVHMRNFVSRMENRKNTRQLLNLKWILSSGVDFGATSSFSSYFSSFSMPVSLVYPVPSFYSTVTMDISNDAFAFLRFKSKERYFDKYLPKTPWREHSETWTITLRLQSVWNKTIYTPMVEPMNEANKSQAHLQQTRDKC